MDDRNAVKGRDDMKYTDLDHQIKRKCQKAKKEYFVLFSEWRIMIFKEPTQRIQDSDWKEQQVK